MNKIRKFIRNILESIEEGLIKTNDIDTAIKVLDKKFGDGIKIIKNENNNSFGIYLSEYNEITINKLFELISNLGFFISLYSINNFQKKFNFNSFFEDINKNINAKNIYLKIESKFDNIEDSDGDIFHVTHIRFLDKIKKIGLVPKTKSKISSHPERIYFVKGKSEAINLATRFSTLEYKFPHNYVLLKVKNEAFNKEKTFSDPNFTNNGFYILNNIHPNLIDFNNSEFFNL